MRPTALLFCLALLLASTAYAQDVTTDHFQADVLRPATEGKEGPLRYGGTPIDWRTAVPGQPEAYPQEPHSEGYLHEVVKIERFERFWVQGVDASGIQQSEYEETGEKDLYAEEGDGHGIPRIEAAGGKYGLEPVFALRVCIQTPGGQVE